MVKILYVALFALATVAMVVSQQSGSEVDGNIVVAAAAVPDSSQGGDEFETAEGRHYGYSGYGHRGYGGYGGGYGHRGYGGYGGYGRGFGGYGRGFGGHGRGYGGYGHYGYRG